MRVNRYDRAGAKNIGNDGNTHSPALRWMPWPCGTTTGTAGLAAPRPGPRYRAGPPWAPGYRHMRDADGNGVVCE